MEHLIIKKYVTYQEYLDQQSSKLSNCQLPWLDSYEKMYQQLLSGLLGFLRLSNSDLRQMRTVLCLGARRGVEVTVFRLFGYECIGIDINPGPDNPLVIKGDFHHLPMETESQDIVYTNCLDHILEPDQFMSEVKRVLKPGGYFMILYASVKAVKGDRFASCSWDSFDNVLELIQGYGFEAIERIPIKQNTFFEAAQILRRTET